MACLGVFSIHAAQMVSVDYSGTHSVSSALIDSFAVSGDGRLAAFASFGTNYTALDTNGLSDLFVHDCLLRSNVWDTTFSAAAVSGNLGSYPVQFTPDGRFLLFVSRATNLVPNIIYPAGAGYQLYVRDLVSSITTLETISPDGSTAGNASVTLAGAAPAPIFMSSDGRFCSFASLSTNLVSSLDTNNSQDVFCRDRMLGVTELITMSPGGRSLDRATFKYAMSTNGRYFAFETSATNVVAGISNTAGTSQVYWRDRLAGTNQAVALDLNGAFVPRGTSLQSMSQDGRFVCFRSIGTNFVLNQNDPNISLDLFIRDMLAGETWLVTRATNGGVTAGLASGGQFSANGEWLLFSAATADLTPGIQDVNGQGLDIFAHHLPTRTNAIVSASYDGKSGADSYTSDNFARISSSGRFVLFTTSATNVMAGLTNHVQRLLVRDMQAGRTLDPLRVSVFPTPAYNEARFAISQDERFIFFLTTGNFDPFVTDTNQQADLFRAPLFAPELRGRLEGNYIHGSGLAGNPYVLEASSNLVNWTGIVTNIAGANGELDLADPEMGSQGRRFYRLVAP
jgi:Tol biopolymer transport system component